MCIVDAQYLGVLMGVRRVFVFAVQVVVVLALSLCILLVINFIDGRYRPVTRAHLLVAGGVDPMGTCMPRPFRSFWHPTTPTDGEGPVNLEYNGEEVGTEFAQYAAMAANNYSDGTKTFDFNDAGLGWQDVAERLDRPGGLSIDVYRREYKGVAYIAMAFKGTRGAWSFVDHLSNASWFLRVLHVDDQYAAARAAVMKIRADQAEWINRRPYAFIAVGHSLGGGLAKHVAAAFPCTAAVTFDASPVSNEYILERPFKHQLVDIFEDEDFLSKHVTHALFPVDDFMVDADYQYYRVSTKPVGTDQHSIVGMTTALSRIALVCVANGLHNRPEYARYCRVSEQEAEGARAIWCKAMLPKWRSGGVDFCSSHDPALEGPDLKRDPDKGDILYDVAVD